MNSKPNFYGRFWADLQRRHVARVGIAYLGLGWGVLAGGELILEIVGAPDWVFRAAVSLVALGFPITLVVAWIFDIDQGQVVRTEDKSFRLGRRLRALLGLPIVAMVVASSWWVWDAYVEEKQRSLRPTDLTDEVPIIAITPIRNLTGDPELDWFGEGIVNLVRDNLSSSRYLHVASPQRWQAITGGAADSVEIGQLAADNDIGFIVSGEMLSTPDGIYVSTRLTDTSGGILLSAEQVEGLQAASILQAAEPIAVQVRKGLGVPREEQVDAYVADFAIDNLAAYELYIRGLGKVVEFDYEGARTEFEAALTLAPDFGVARYRLALSLAVLHKTDLAEQNLLLAAEDPFLLPRERAYIESYTAFVKRDYGRAETLVQALLQEHPYEIEARQLLAQIYYQQYRLESAEKIFAELVSELPRSQDPLAFLGMVQLEQGKVDEAGEVFKRLLEVAPDNPNSHFEMARWSRARGDISTARRYVQQALAIKPGMLGAATFQAELLFLAGDRPRALEAFMAIAQNAVMSPRERTTAMFNWTALLEAKGDYSAALAGIESLKPQLEVEKIKYPMAFSRTSRVKLAAGDFEGARAAVETALALPSRVPTRHLFARGQLELATGANQQVLDTARDIRSYAAAPGDPDRTEEKAASYLEGMVALQQDKPEQARQLLTAAVDLHGYPYALYAGPLASLLFRQDEDAEARKILERALVVDPKEPRIDLEPQREVYRAMLAGQP